MKKETDLNKFTISCRNCAEQGIKVKFEFTDPTVTLTFLCEKCGSYEYVEFGLIRQKEIKITN